MSISTIFLLIMVFIGFFVLPLILWLLGKNKKSNFIVGIIFVSYIIILFFGVTSKIDYNLKTTTIELDYSLNWADKVVNWTFKDLSYLDVLINIYMLIPIGHVVVYCSKRLGVSLIIKLVIIGLLYGVLIETIQFVLPVPRSVQLSDVIFNTISVCIGGGLGCLYKYIANKVM